MTMEQQQVPDVRSQLLDMGFPEGEADRALNAGHVDITRAVHFLSEDPPPPEKNAHEFPSLPSMDAATSINSSPAPVRKLTNARDSLDGIDINNNQTSTTDAGPGHTTQPPFQEDDIQKVLELSRQEQDRREMEEAIRLSKQEEVARQQQQDPDIQLAIQASLKDNTHAADRAVSWQSHGFRAVRERARKGLEDPVGLKNIGNTCYLNSLLQVYYHLPDFRRAVMAFRPKEDHIQPSTAEYQYLPNQPLAHGQQSTVVTPEDEIAKNESQQERMERKISDSQMEQSFDPPSNGDELMKPVDGACSVNESHNENKDGDPVCHAVQFVIELQRLFAAMALGNQNCVDPSDVAHAMRDSEGKPIVIGAQQDASEFNHLFLDIVERGLRSEEPDTSSNPEVKEESPAAVEPLPPVINMDESYTPGNVVKDLFTIRFRQEIRNISDDGDSQVSSRQGLPVTINGETNAIIVDATANRDRDLHDGLDDYAHAYIDYKFDEKDGSANPKSAMVEGEIPTLKGMPTFSPPSGIAPDKMDTSNSKVGSPAVKAVWFTRMPPVFVIYLQRVVYNRDTNQAEKVHDKYGFPCEIAFDRYLEANRAEAGTARGIVQRIRKNRVHLQSSLSQYEKFPIGGSYAGERINKNGMLLREESLQNQVKMSEVQGNNAYTAGTGGIGENMDTDQTNNREDFFSAAQRVQARFSASLNPSWPDFLVDGVAEDKVQSAIETLRVIVEQDRARCDELKQKLHALDEEEAGAYHGLDTTKYRLHAVLVHDGAPSGGHYWTFIRNWSADSDDAKWMKLSDSVVTFVRDEEMLEWSAGGKSRASAYCLIYAFEPSLEGKDKYNGASIAKESRERLPSCRIEEVDRNSVEFEREMQERTANARM